MALVIEILWIVKHQVVPHVYREVLAVEIVVPKATLWNHEEAEELIRKDHLHLLVEALVVVVWLIGLH